MKRDLPIHRPRDLCAFSPREQKVSALLAQGLEVKAIAEQLRVGPVSVRSCISLIRDKLGVETTAQAIAKLKQQEGT